MKAYIYLYVIYICYIIIFGCVIFVCTEDISKKNCFNIAVVCGGVKSCGNDSEIDGSRNFKQSKVLLKGIYLLNF